ncbi:MAG: orotate phosphoribosyltransferase [Actinobacteria bacterium]|nr:orotate phosphoribosyltransferase [Actinomycetota bacterium]
MTNTSQAKHRLIELIKELAVVHGKVTLSSGIEADYYVDLRRATLHHEAAPLIGQIMLDLLDQNSITDFVAIGGLTMGADPVATAVLHQANNRGRKIDAFVVRKQAKAHGMGRQVEGPDVSGKKVVVVEDTSTTGGSPLTAAEARFAS